MTGWGIKKITPGETLRKPQGLQKTRLESLLEGGKQ